MLSSLSSLPGIPNTTHLHFTLSGQRYDAISFEATEAISAPFKATLYVLSEFNTTWLGQPAQITFSDTSGHERTLAGIVTHQRDRGLNARKQSRVEIELRPRLWVLSQTTDNRVFQGHSVPDIVTSVLKQHGIDSASGLWHLERAYPVQPYTVQYQETDLEFVERLLSRIGVSYWFTVSDGKDIVHFTDDNAHFTRLDLGAIPFIPDAGLDKPIACFNKYLNGVRQVPANVQVVDYNPLSPDNVIQGGSGNGAAANDSAHVHYGLGTSGPDEAEWMARIINERHAVDGVRVEIAGSAAGLLPGGVFGFVHPRFAKYTGDYLVMRLTHSISQQAAVEHEADIGSLAYTLYAHLVPRSLPYRPVLLPPLRLPAVYTAHIESNGEYALLDEHGRFRVRQLFDTRDTEDAGHAEASLPVRSLSFYGSPPGSGGATGAAFPFRDGVEVLWASVDGDPNRPVILGSLPNPDSLSPVTSRNFGDNIIRTGGKNELVMHDIKGEEHIELKQGDYDRPFNLMRLDANSAGHSIKFACTMGAMEFYAKKTMKVEAGDSITQTHGNDRTETIENTHTLTTKNKDIHYQAATDQTHTASQSIHHKAEKNIEHKAAENTQWRVARDSIITIKQGDQIVKIDNGDLYIEAAKGISIKGTGSGSGSGSIKIGQGDAGIEIDSGGKVKLFGKTVTVEGTDGVKLKGKINYEIGKGGKFSGKALEPLAVSALVPLGVEYRDAVLHFPFPSGTNASSRFILSEDSNRYRQEKTAADDIDPTNDTLDLKYEQLPIPGSYTLVMESDQGKMVLFEGLPSSSFVSSTPQ